MGTLKHANPSANQRSLNRKTNRKNRSTMSWQVSVVANLLLIKNSTSCWSMSACYSSCFSQHKKHPKKLSNTSVKDKALGFQLHQQPRQLLSVFLVLAKLFMALHSKSFSEAMARCWNSHNYGNHYNAYINKNTTKYQIIGKVQYTVIQPLGMQKL